MVSEELRADPGGAAAAIEHVGIRFDRGPGVGEDQVVVVLQGAEQVIGDRCEVVGLGVVAGIGARPPGGLPASGRSPPSGRRAGAVAAQLEPDLAGVFVGGDNLYRRALPRAQELRRRGEVAECRGQRDPGNAAAKAGLHPVQLGLQLRTALGADERVQFVDDHVAQVAKDPADSVPVVDEHRFYRLGGDQQDTVRGRA